MMIGAVQRQLIVMEPVGAGELSRLPGLSGGSGRARTECGITHSIDAAVYYFPSSHIMKYYTLHQIYL